MARSGADREADRRDRRQQERRDKALDELRALPPEQRLLEALRRGAGYEVACMLADRPLDQLRDDVRNRTPRGRRILRAVGEHGVLVAMAAGDRYGKLRVDWWRYQQDSGAYSVETRASARTRWIGLLEEISDAA